MIDKLKQLYAQKPDRLIMGFLFLLAFVQYANTIPNDYAWDDALVVTENPRVQRGISGIPDLFFKHHSDHKYDQYGYRPVVLTTFAIEYSIFGLNPHAQHFMNILYFAILCLVLYKVLRQLFHEHKRLFALLVVVLFIVHPIHVEAVANIKSRDEILAFLFGLLALRYFLLFYTKSHWKYLGYMVLAFGLGYLCKEGVAAMLGVMAISLFYIDYGNWKRIAKFLIPIPVLLGAAYLIFKVSFESNLGAASTAGLGAYHENMLLGNSFFYLHGFGDIFPNSLLLLMQYLKNFFVPHPLVYFYGYNQIPVTTTFSVGVAISFFVHLGGLVFALVRIPKSPLLSFGILFYLINIFLYSHLLIILNDTMADRFMFTASLGLCIVVVALLAWIFRVNLETGSEKLTTNQLLPKLYVGTLGIIALVLLVMTFNRNGVWKDNATLFAHDLPNLENCSRAHYYYANTLLEKGQTTGMTPELEAEMISEFEKAIAISDSAYYAYLNLALYHCEKQDFAKGKKVLERMLAYYSTTADPNFYYGQVLFFEEDYASAQPYLEKAVQYSPKQEGNYYYLGICYAKTKSFNEGLQLMNTYQSEFGESWQYHEAMGHLTFEMGQLETSLRHLMSAIDTGGNPTNAYATAIHRCEQMGEMELAQSFYQEAVSLGYFQAQ